MSGRGKTSYRKNLFKKYPILKIGVVAFVATVVLLRIIIPIYETSDIITPISVPVGAGAEVPECPSLIGKKLVALTFDDGPGTKTTPRLLDILKKNNVCATFFTLGGLAEQNPEIVKREKDECHEVASHTISHSQLSKMSESEIRWEIGTSETILQNITGEKPTLLRPPYGVVNDAVQGVSDLSLILWSVDTLDWKYRNTESIVGRAMEQVKDGGIILMHDIYETSVDAVETLIATLRNEGYEFLTVSELAIVKGVELKAGEIYYHF